MQDYKSLYFKLFNDITDVIRLLQEAQQQTEYISSEPHETKLVNIKQPQQNDSSSAT